MGGNSSRDKKAQNDAQKEKARRRPRVSIDETITGAQVAKTKPGHYKKWTRCFKYFCCCTVQDKDSIEDVANLFAEFFADHKITASEIVAGWVLLSKFQVAQQEYIVKSKQNGIEQFMSGIPIKADTKFLDFSKPDDSHLLNDLIYYMNYSLAIFGWPLQLLESPYKIFCTYPKLVWAGCCACPQRRRAQRPHADKEQQEANEQQYSNEARKLEKAIQAGLDSNGCANSDPIVEADNCCSCNWASVEHRLEEHNFEIIHLTYRSEVGVVPFLVASDHARATVVVSIRGSMAMSDVVTDFLGHAERMPIDDCPEDWLSHRGMTRAALYVKRRLLEERLLESAFECRPDWGSRDYKLLLCGHSLGAGVAAILGVLMRPQYPDLRAYLYSPPGGVLSVPVVDYTKEFAVGIILGEDAVARIGMAQLERLKYQTGLALKNSDRSSSGVLVKGLLPNCCLGANEVEYDPKESVDLLLSTTSKPFEFKGKEVRFQSMPVILYVPGRLIHIVRNNRLKARRSSVSSRKVSKEPIYQAIWSEDNTLYDRLFICKNMFKDHMPDMLIEAMKKLTIRTLPDRRKSIMPTLQQPLSSTSKNSNQDNRQTKEQAVEVNQADRVASITKEISSVEKSENDAKSMMTTSS